MIKQTRLVQIILLPLELGQGRSKHFSGGQARKWCVQKSGVMVVMHALGLQHDARCYQC